MAAQATSKTTQAVRVARSAPRAPLQAAAESAGVAMRTLVSKLGSMPYRGFCAAAAAGAATRSDISRRRFALRHEACPACVIRAAATPKPADGAVDGSVAGWAARDAQRDHVVAADAGCTPQRLAALALYAHPGLLRRLCLNPGCPPVVIAALATDPDVSVAAAAARHPACPAAVAAQVHTARR